jgi:hypothetical protein
LSDSTIPRSAASKPALFGFAIKQAAPPARKRPKRKPPLRACGERHWPAVCARCLENEPTPALLESAQLSELPGETFEDIFGGAA